MNSTNFIILQHFLCLILAPITCYAWHFNTSFYILWCSDNNFDQHSSYKSNLRVLLSSLASNAATSADIGYNETNTAAIAGTDHSETIYGLFECRGDSTAEDCRKCVVNAINYLPPMECPRDKGVIIWHRSCKIRYSDKFFLGIVVEDVNYGWSNNQNVSTVTKDVDGFMNGVGDTLRDLGTQVSSQSSGKGNTRYYGTKTLNIKSLKLYTMAECLADLAPNDCERCLGIAINELSTCCYGSKGGTALNPSCYARFEIYPFYKAVTSGSQSQTLSPLPQPQGDSNGKNPELSRKHRRRKKLLFISLLCALATSIALALLLFFGIRIRLHKKAMETSDSDVDETKTVVDSLEFDFNTIKTATSNFSADYKVGEGGFGEVYKGKLKDGQEVAVKRLSKNTGHGIEQFKTEVVLVARLQHKNLVKLLGYCESSKEKMLVYEFLPNSSLDKYLFGSKEEAMILDWQTRFKIIVGIARGLLYLHEDSRLKIVHRDLKSSNILLDDDMNPKISDFGLAKLFGEDQTQGDTRKIVGTYGYLAPEYAITGRYSVKSDVYSFGVIILEILSGHRNSYFGEMQQEEPLLSYAWRLWNEDKALELVDAALNKNFLKDDVMKCIHISLLCVQELASERPHMTTIVAALNGQAIDFPMPKRPLFAGTLIDPKRLEHCDSSSTYSGFDTITVLQARD